MTSRRTTGPAGPGPVKAQIRNSEEGYFWKQAVEKTASGKPVDEKSQIDIQRTAPKASTQPTTAPTTAPTTEPTTAPTTAPVVAQAPPAAAPPNPFVLLDESTPNSRVRGVSVAYWLFVAVAAALPLLWFGGRALRGGKGDVRPDRISPAARLFSAAASLSILLAFALGLVWAKSWYVGDRLSWRDPNQPRFFDVHSARGEFVLHFRKVDDEKTARTMSDLATAPNGLTWRQDADSAVGYTTKTFCFEHENLPTAEGHNRSFTVAAPYWFLMILALVLPSWWLRNQKYGPIQVTTFGGPAAAKGKPIHGYSSFNRPI